MATSKNNTVRKPFINLCFLLATSYAQSAEFECLIKPNQIVEIRSAAVGLIDKVTVDQGDVVEKGKVLAVLESATEQATAELAKFRAQMNGPLKTAEARLEHATQKFNRKDELHKQKFVTTEDRDEARAEKRVAEAAIGEAKENKQLAVLEHKRTMTQLALRSVKSPVSGVITERLLNPGEVAELGVGQKPIVKIAELNPLRVEVILPMAMYGQIKMGQGADIVPEAHIGGRHRGVVKAVDKLIDAASATFAVRVEVKNDDFKLPAGVKCRADFLAIDTQIGASPRAKNGSVRERK